MSIFKRTKWCCEGFKAHYHAVGERGFAIVVSIDFENEAAFTLQHRAVDAGVTLPNTGGHPVSLATEIGLRYCPWCGRDLAKWYRKFVDDLVAGSGPRIFED